MPNPPVKVDTTITDLTAGTIPSAWTLEGAPQTRSTNIVRSQDWMLNLVLWECTAGRFTWHYPSDEVLIVVSGEAFLLKEPGKEQRFGPGDIGYFPAGTIATWRVPEAIRKVAVVRETTWGPIGFCVKALNKILRVLGLKGKSALMLALAFATLGRR